MRLSKLSDMLTVLTNPTLLTKLVSLYVLALVFTGCLADAGYCLVTHTDIPAFAYSILSGGVFYAVNQLGLHQGLVMVNTGLAEKMKQQLVAQQVNPTEGG